MLCENFGINDIVFSKAEGHRASRQKTMVYFAFIVRSQYHVCSDLYKRYFINSMGV